MNTSLFAQPGRVGWIASLMKQLLEEVRVVPVGLAARARIAEIHGRAGTRLERGLSLDVVNELAGITVPFCGQRRQATAPGVEQDHPLSRIDRLLDNIETSQLGQQRQRQRRADARRDAAAMALAAEDAAPDAGISPPADTTS
jgi:Protein of unknown function (DUF2587)